MLAEESVEVEGEDVAQSPLPAIHREQLGLLKHYPLKKVGDIVSSRKAIKKQWFSHKSWKLSYLQRFTPGEVQETRRVLVTGRREPRLKTMAELVLQSTFCILDERFEYSFFVENEERK